MRIMCNDKKGKCWATGNTLIPETLNLEASAPHLSLPYSRSLQVFQGPKYPLSSPNLPEKKIHWSTFSHN